MAGTVRLNKVITPNLEEHSFLDRATQYVEGSTLKQIFMSHKTGDQEAERVAKHIAQKHRVIVYLAEWDTNVSGDSPTLPDYIMKQIKRSNGFLVHVTPRIAISMWVGYEIGGAHASGIPRAKLMKQTHYDLPSVVEALRRISSDHELDTWITVYVL